MTCTSKETQDVIIFFCYCFTAVANAKILSVHFSSEVLYMYMVMITKCAGHVFPHSQQQTIYTTVHCTPCVHLLYHTTTDYSIHLAKGVSLPASWQCAVHWLKLHGHILWGTCMRVHVAIDIHVTCTCNLQTKYDH